MSMLSSQGFAAAPTAVLHAIGPATINGRPVIRSATIFENDIIQTADSTASLEMDGAAVLLDKNSTVVLEDNELKVICGGAFVTTLKGLSARVGNLLVKPSNQVARFKVFRGERSVRITAIEGELSVLQGNKSVALKASQWLEVDCSQCMQGTTLGAKADLQAANQGNNDNCGLATMIVHSDLGGAMGTGIAVAAIPILIELFNGEPMSHTPMSPDHP